MIIISIGSSPLARGLPGRPKTSLLDRRIIPARAGFTSAFEPVSNPGEDHPRSRGVYASVILSRMAGAGSSPLARGLLAGFTTITGTSRIIPARAGFTIEVYAWDGGWRDHPRSRGVYQQIVSDDAAKKGSSPLARGLLHLEIGRVIVHGIIPARAGFTAVS